MKNRKEIICISCPIGCQLVVTEENGQYTVEGNNCKNGEKYGIEEMSNPKRVIPSTVKIINGFIPRLPVKTQEPIPKELIFDIMKEINKTEVTAPVKQGDIIISNVLGTGVDVVATRSIDKI